MYLEDIFSSCFGERPSLKSMTLLRGTLEGAKMLSHEGSFVQKFAQIILKRYLCNQGLFKAFNWSTLKIRGFSTSLNKSVEPPRTLLNGSNAVLIEKNGARMLAQC